MDTFVSVAEEEKPDCQGACWPESGADANADAVVPDEDDRVILLNLLQPARILRP